MSVRLVEDSVRAVARPVYRRSRQWGPLIEATTLAAICVVAFCVRLFAVVRFESVIHEFDPYFNFRATQFLSEKGYYEFWNWFDAGSWYPLGRVIGQTLFPGLMTTAYVLWQFLKSIGLPVPIKDVCVFTAPVFSCFSCIAAHLLAREASGLTEAGLLSAIFVGLSPSYMSRSVGGSYDNEAVAIFALIFAFFLIVRAFRRASQLWASIAALGYFYMVASWGGYIFVTNTVAIYVAVLLALNRFTVHHFVTYSTFYFVGTLLCLNIPFVNFAAVKSSEHMSSHGIFLVSSVHLLFQFIRDHLPSDFRVSKVSARHAAWIVGISFLALFGWLSLTGRTAWAGRSLTLLDPTYATKHIPIIASVSEHQPALWSSYMLDLHPLILCGATVGLVVCFCPKTFGMDDVETHDALLFVGLYGLLSFYFSGVMARLMLVLAPAACVLAGIGLSVVLTRLMEPLRPFTMHNQTSIVMATFNESKSTTPSEDKKSKSKVSPAVSIVAILVLFVFCLFYIIHGVWASSAVYSSPSIVTKHVLSDGTTLLQDDFREAYSWFRENTHPDVRLMSWWDYGYQSCTMGNRTVIVDNNTWNNTHIATVGMAFASPEDEAFRVIERHDVDYVFVVFGGTAGYSGDDINKFLWMIRIGGRVYPFIKEDDFFTASGKYAVGRDAPPAMKNSLLYKLSYYRFHENARGSFDTVRRENVQSRDISLKYFDEAFTTSNWIVRVYKVKRRPNRHPHLSVQLQKHKEHQ